MINRWKRRPRKDTWLRVHEFKNIQNGLYWTSNHSNGWVMNERTLRYVNGVWLEPESLYLTKAPTHFKNSKIS